ncbi:TPA: hypothetical protein ACTTVN_003873, partial [Legionella anisa]
NTNGVSLYQCSIFAKFLHGISVSICPTPSPQPSSAKNSILLLKFLAREREQIEARLSDVPR